MCLRENRNRIKINIINLHATGDAASYKRLANTNYSMASRFNFFSRKLSLFS